MSSWPDCGPHAGDVDSVTIPGAHSGALLALSLRQPHGDVAQLQT